MALPFLLLIAIGVLEIGYPHSSFHPDAANYNGYNQNDIVKDSKGSRPEKN